MDNETIIKLVTAIVTILGALLAFLHFLTTRRSVGYQNSKTEMELLSQSVAAHEADPDFKQFLMDVRKEKISFLVFGIPIPNADVERVIAYYRKAEGKVTTEDIAKAWRYRSTKVEHLSFQLRGAFKAEYVLTCIFAVFCILSALGGVLFLLFFDELTLQSLALICLSLVAFFLILWMDQGLFVAARLGKMEK